MPAVVEDLKTLRLEANEELRLPNSACINVTDQELTESEPEKLCNQIAAPEPSSVLSLLALGTLGTTSLLTRKQKVNQHDKD